MVSNIKALLDRVSVRYTILDFHGNCPVMDVGAFSGEISDQFYGQFVSFGRPKKRSVGLARQILERLVGIGIHN